MYQELESGCWKWLGATCSNGRYGRVPGFKPMKMAHREAYEKAYGPIPNGLFVCHSCDFGLCVNPDHLFLGTHSDNMKDAAKKGRIPRLLNQSGSNNSNAKYTKEFAERVIAYYKSNKPSFSALAKAFNLKSKGHAHTIVTGKIWN